MRCTAVVALLLTVLICPEAQACKCLPPPPPLEAMKTAGAVFSGKVLSLQTKDTKVIVEIEVQEIWKGVEKKTVQIETGTHSCGWEFTGGESYLFYTRDDMTVDRCTRTQVLKDATADLKQLGAGHKPK